MEINKNREDFEKREAMESEKTTHQQLPEKSSETVSKADPAETDNESLKDLTGKSLSLAEEEGGESEENLPEEEDGDFEEGKVPEEEDEVPEEEDEEFEEELIQAEGDEESEDDLPDEDDEEYEEDFPEEEEYEENLPEEEEEFEEDLTIEENQTEEDEQEQEPVTEQAVTAPDSQDAPVKNGEARGTDKSGKVTAGDSSKISDGGNGGGKRRRHRTAFWITMLLIIAVLGGIYAYGYQYCETHFMPGTRINGYDCSRMTVEEAETRFAEAAKDYVLNVRFRGGSTEILHADDIGFEYDSDGSVDKLLQEQDSLVWPKYFFEDSLYEIKPGGRYDPDQLTAALQALPELQKDNMEKPKDAYIRFQDGDDEVDGEFVIVPDTAGSKIDLVQLSAGVGDAAARYTDMVDAEEIAGAYVEASVKADNAKLVARCKDLNDLVGASITYVLPDGGTIKLNSDVMKDWLVEDKNGKLIKDDDVWDEKLWEFLEKLAVNSNTLGMSRQFQSTTRGLITVSGGDYGYMVNQVTEHDKLVEDLAEGKKETRKPDYYISPYNEETENDGIGTTYIEADLTAQHIWCYVNGQMVMESDCVSGDITTDHGTPTGVFGIMFMKKDATLRGVMQSNGKPEYETKVAYWMPFYADCGFHDAWWRTGFGGSIYKGDGSHGCINLPVSAAETLFSYCDDKMPVVVYY